ncbi:hypothetical protein KR054_001302, partial [Drosophila jambulina]
MIYENILRFFSLMAGSFYPAFVSYKLLSAKNENNEKLSIWLTYWIVYGVWTTIDFLTTGMGACIPFFGEMKLVFICWLLPSIGAGSQMIYNDFLHSFFSNNEGTIEHALIHASLWVVDFLDRMLRTCLSHIMGVVDDYLLTRGLHEAQTPPPIRIDDYFAKIELERKQKLAKTDDLENSIEKALGEDENLLLNKTESEELVFAECKMKPKILPKPNKGQGHPSLDQDIIDLKTMIN